MADDDFESFLQVGAICGTARLAMAALASEKQFRRALRAQARGRLADAKTEMTAALAGWNVREIPIAAVEAAFAAILFGTQDLAESERLREKSLPALLAWARELDENIASLPKTMMDHPMWISRLTARRALAAYVLGDYRGADALYREALAIMTSIGSAEVPQVGDDYATLLIRMGRAAEAEPFIAQARAGKSRSTYDTE